MVCGKDFLVLGELAHHPVVGFKRICGVDDAPDFLRILKICEKELLDDAIAFAFDTISTSGISDWF